MKAQLFRRSGDLLKEVEILNYFETPDGVVDTDGTVYYLKLKDGNVEYHEGVTAHVGATEP